MRSREKQLRGALALPLRLGVLIVMRLADRIDPIEQTPEQADESTSHSLLMPAARYEALVAEIARNQ